MEARRADGAGAARTAASRSAPAPSTTPSTGRCSPRSSGCRSSRGRRSRASRWATPTTRTSATSTTSSKTNLAQNVREYDEIQQRDPGHPVGELDRRRPPGRGLLLDGRRDPERDRRRRVGALAGGLLGRAGVATFPLTGIAVLDGVALRVRLGHRPRRGERRDLSGPIAIPRLFRDDYVHNGNDSHWVSNPEEPLTGFDRIIGDEETERSLRTRIGLLQVQQRLDGSDGLAGQRLHASSSSRDIALGNRQYAGELWRDELVALCESSPTQTGSSGPVDVSRGLPGPRGLGRSRRPRLERRDPLPALRREPARQLPVPADRRLERHVHGLERDLGPAVLRRRPGQHPQRAQHRGNPLVGQALADAVTDLQGAGIPLDAGLRGHQYETRGGEQIPIHGGPGDVGLFNAINVAVGSRLPATRTSATDPASSRRCRSARRAARCGPTPSSPTGRPRTRNRPTPPTTPAPSPRSAGTGFPFCGRDVRTAPGVQSERIRPGG